jgi:L-threonylcarbamoyladenylate synthase
MIHIAIKENNTDEAVSKAIDVLHSGGIIAYPTETFYGLGVKFDMPDALKRLYELKKRPHEKAMPVIIGDCRFLPEAVDEEWLKNIPLTARSLMDEHWPGPLTLLFPAKEGLSEHLTAGTGRIAVRVPGESFALCLAKKAGFPITATSANISGMPPAEDAEAVIKYFGNSIDLLIDGGSTPGGLPSTIVDISEGRIKIVREGAAKII